MTTNKELQKRKDNATPRGLGNMFSVFVDKAENSEVVDIEGKKYIDFGSGISVLNTGHLHPKVKRAAAAQLDKFTHTCFMVTPYESYVALAEKLNEIVPGDTPKKTLFFNSGAEAVENAVKIARAHTGRPAIISFQGGFHGRTMMAMALTGKIIPYKAKFGPFPAETYHAPYPIEYHGISVADALKGLEAIFKYSVEPNRVAAIIMEPVLGEGGFYPAPVAFVQEIRKICDTHGIVMVADEIQTGFARTGKMFASEYAGIEPDLMTLAKSMAGGFPISAVTGKANIMDAPDPGGLGGTYGGSPIACAAGLAVIEAIEEENLVARANDMGEMITARFRAMAEKNKKLAACFGDIRHRGAMIALELVKDNDPDQPDADLAKALTQKAIEKGLILLSCGIYGNVIRLLIPLTAPDNLISEGLDIIEASFSDLV
jgi:4-aminobutyrate aminotransferase/(S)-3-amino-2-methylpropionate transaminase